MLTSECYRALLKSRLLCVQSTNMLTQGHFLIDSPMLSSQVRPLLENITPVAKYQTQAQLKQPKMLTDSQNVLEFPTSDARTFEERGILEHSGTTTRCLNSDGSTQPTLDSEK